MALNAVVGRMGAAWRVTVGGFGMGKSGGLRIYRMLNNVLGRVSKGAPYGRFK